MVDIIKVMTLFLKILKWTVIILVGLFVVAEIIRWPFRVREERTAEQVAKIHATKLQLSDVMGDNLPPDPGEQADDTIEGIDANQNGIRDDVELAIFKEYPNSAKTRAPLLQYALALQMEFVQPIINKETVTEVATEQSRADSCLADQLVPRKSPESYRTEEQMEKIAILVSYVEDKQFNTKERENAHHDFYQGNLGSYGESTNEACDIDSSQLS